MKEQPWKGPIIDHMGFLGCWIEKRSLKIWKHSCVLCCRWVIIIWYRRKTTLSAFFLLAPCHWGFHLDSHAYKLISIVVKFGACPVRKQPGPPCQVWCIRQSVYTSLFANTIACKNWFPSILLRAGLVQFQKYQFMCLNEVIFLLRLKSWNYVRFPKGIDSCWIDWHTITVH